MNKTIQNKIHNAYAHRTQDSYDEALKCVDEIKDYLLNCYDHFQNGNMDAGFELMIHVLQTYFGCDMDTIELYRHLKCSRAEFHAKIVDCLQNVGRGYKKQIAESICDDVAEDIKDCSDLRHWDESDIAISVGKVLLGYVNPEADV